MLSVICPIYNEEKYIAKCIDSILAQDYPKDDMEVIFVDGMSKDRTREIVADYLNQYDFIKLLDNPQKIAPCAMNIGIKAAKGDLIMRLDGHAFYEKDYFSKIVEWHNKMPEAWNVGGVCETKVVKQNLTSNAIAKVMSDKFGVGNSKFRTGSDEEWLETDTVPFGCYKREVFDKIGLYNEKLVRVQDIELNKRVKQAGGKIIMVPSIKCNYIPRDNYRAFYNNRYLTGFWVIRTCFITKTTKNLGLRHFIPALFVLSIILPIIASIICPWFSLISAFVVLLYGVSILLRSIHIKDNTTTVLHIVVAFCCIHFSYGLGSIVALIKSSFSKLN